MSRFSAQLKAAQDRVEDEISDISRAVMLELDARVVLRTPVDTGRARGNWMPSIGAPATTEGQSSLGEAQALHSSSTGFDTMYLTNNLPYIEALENGHSGQAPQGMVKLSVQEIAKKFK